MKLKPLFLVLALLVCSTLSAQELVNPVILFSKQKDSYVTMQDGSELVGLITGVKRNKGLIREIKFTGSDGQKQKINPDKIQHMYVQPTALDKLSNALDKATDTQRWEEESINHDLLKEGYVYYENAEVLVKKKKRTLLMQLLNPHFGAKVKVYHDPLARETASAGIGGFKVAGGDAKSYYVQFGDEAAFKLEKKRYRKMFDELYKDCPSTVRKYSDSVNWGDLPEHITSFTDCSRS